MRLIAILLAVLGACGTLPPEKRRRPRVTPGAPLPWATIQIENEQDALWVWVKLRPTGADYEEKLADIPAQFRQPMAIALLREGRLECEVIEETDGCGNTNARFAGPTAESGIDDGCLRRKLAAWAVAQLDAEGLEQVQYPILAFTKLPLPERELHAVALRYLVDPGGRPKPMVIAAIEKIGDEATADAAVDGLDRSGLVELAQKGVDGALDRLLADAKPDELAWVIAAYGQPDELARIRRETWRRVIGTLQTMRTTTAGDSTRAIVDRAITTIVAGGDCELAGEAGVVDRASREAMATQEDWNYMACFWIAAQGPTSRFLRDMVSAQGLTVKRTGAKAADDVVLGNDAGFEMPFAEELPAVLRSCTGTSCQLPGTYVRFELMRDDKGRLTQIERHDDGGC
jgi:hypothetical protein